MYIEMGREKPSDFIVVPSWLGCLQCPLPTHFTALLWYVSLLFKKRKKERNRKEKELGSFVD